jgi:hypothetical protein
VTRQQQFDAILAELLKARRSGNQDARDDAEWALTRLLQGEAVEMPVDYKLKQSGEAE